MNSAEIVGFSALWIPVDDTWHTGHVRIGLTPARSRTRNRLGMADRASFEPMRPWLAGVETSLKSYDEPVAGPLMWQERMDLRNRKNDCRIGTWFAYPNQNLRNWE
jgi:hypothetical protein